MRGKYTKLLAMMMTEMVIVKLQLCVVQQHRKQYAAIELKLLRYYNIGSFYNFVNGKLYGSSKLNTPLRNATGELRNDSTKKSNIFNSFFSSIFYIDDGSNITRLAQYNGEELSLITFTPYIVM